MSDSLFRLIVIGASAGAFESLSAVLPTLPENFPVPIVVVVHLPPDKKSLMADLFKQRCKIDAKEAEDKEPLKAGTVYFAPPDYHLLIEEDARASLSSEEPVLHSRPSIDVLFETAAEAFGKDVLGIVLSGANADGARGLKIIVDAGGSALVQLPSTAFATAMPTAALNATQSAQALTLEQIASYLQKVQAA